MEKQKIDKRIVEVVRRTLNTSRAAADKAKKDLIEANVVLDDLTINPYFATFIGISILYSKIEISVIGMDGIEVPWIDILSKISYSPKEFNGKFEFNYTTSELICISTHINQLIKEIQSILSVKAICIAFDDADIKDTSFSLIKYDIKNCSYSFWDFCEICFKEIKENIPIFLERNAMCQLVLIEFPMLRREYNNLYVNIEQNGCFAAVLSYGTLHCGYNMQTLNLSGLLTKTEKEALASNDINNIILLSICTRILKSLVILLAPKYIYINGKLL